MDSEPPDETRETKKQRNFPTLELNTQLDTVTQPILVIQSPKTPTLSRKLKAVSLDSDPQNASTSLDLSRDVFSMPNTPKRHIKQKLLSEFSDDGPKSTLLPCFPSNLKKFASNASISGSQTLKTLPEIMTLQDFTDNVKPEPVKVKPKGLLERRGSNASLTIDLGSNSNIAELKIQPLHRLNTARSVSNLNLSSYETEEKCACMKKLENGKKTAERRKSQETCGNCVIYESVPSKVNHGCKTRCQMVQKPCASKCRRKSLSNENLYVPPCNFCQNGVFKECVGTSKSCKGYRKAHYPRQPDIEVDQLLSEDFKNHLQNMHYLQTAGSVLTIQELKAACEDARVPKLHQEFWEVPLNLQEKCYVSGSQNKNRYRGVLPNEHSRVHLPGVQNYIHANYIKGPDYTETAYIATQGPMSHTCHDFWNMIWYTNCRIIVMLTGLVEKGKNKCELYFPLGKRIDSPEANKFFVKTTRPKDKFTFDGRHNTQQLEEEIFEYEALDEVTFGDYRIRYLREENDLQNCPLRYLEVLKLNEKNDVIEGRRVVKHYWFTNWPDHKMADSSILLKVALKVLENLSENELTDKNPFSYTVTKKPVDAETDNPFDIRLRRTPKMTKSQRFSVTKSMSDDIKPSVIPKERHAQRRKSSENAKVPLVTHCSAGIGRTGCFLAILNGIQQLRNNANVDVLAILCSLRLNRGGMVQTAEQYELIHKVLNLFVHL